MPQMKYQQNVQKYFGGGEATPIPLYLEYTISHSLEIKMVIIKVNVLGWNLLALSSQAGSYHLISSSLGA